MSSGVKGLDVTIMGREFRVACPENEQQSLLDSVAYLDKKMREIRDAGKVIGVERIAIMAALNIAHEFLGTRLAGSFDIGEYKRRMTSMQAQIEQAMADQDELF
ncbi:MAG: cell division protein ZapA [Hydrogenophilales bacterium CG_4_9_14_3_um_filter_59_35]|nr:MAG: cell division protein ZapA [Hydrogenophilales bacterium CG18_big_fil_WC_8_21_14_2_50_58_12]PIX99554.1 MAG: cell division protein ZapA [Hydrogenophilales bacterium CG_4_10_14_3_um_filter_58_23]PJB03624.1 MAG: cell division protein ZapA [Hydrogenophilales bacterium CG_4_9_14_3_um_filter_59_35]